MKIIIGIILTGIIFYTGCGNVGNFAIKGYTPPTVKHVPKVFYPVEAQENSISGNTEFMLYVDNEGRVVKTYLLKSSGYSILDSTAENYCRDLIFNPALGNGKPIGARLNWKVNFDVKYEDLAARQFIFEMNSLYRELDGSLPKEREEIMREIIAKDIRFVRQMTDELNFNRTIKKVLLPKTVTAWRRYLDNYPLPFLLFYDFIQRFPDYSKLPAVRIKMLDELNNDIRFIKNMPNLDRGKKGTRKILLRKLQYFSGDNALKNHKIKAEVALE